MGRRLNATVYLHDENDVVRGFGPGDVIPEWVAEQITNPDVWEDDDSADGADEAPGDGAPPRTGKGSSAAAWLAYAKSLGVDVAEDAGRDEIIAAVEALD